MSDIQHAHLYGTREAKYDWLSTHDVNSTDWDEIEPQKPFHLFIPQNNDSLAEFQEYWKITKVMPINSVGIVTGQDAKTIAFSYEEVEKLAKITEVSKDSITKIFYRPFDLRWITYDGKVVTRSRKEVMKHIELGDNLALVTSRLTKGETFHHAQVSQNIIEVICMSPKTSNNGFVFPLYSYIDKNAPQQSTFTEKRRPNFSDEFLTEITNKLGYTPTPEAIFYYIYAIFHSPTYRTRYAEFLKIDFPRVPITSDDQLFRKLGEYGEELVALHLMKSPKLDQHLTQIIDKGGEFIVDAGHPKYTDGEVIINKKGDRFTGVPKSVWEFYVGGYQVCHKWLKDRKGRQLSPEDLNHYQKIIVALSETMQIMNAIDAAIPSFPIE
jgi:predicted helicase